MSYLENLYVFTHITHSQYSMAIMTMEKRKTQATVYRNDCIYGVTNCCAAAVDESMKRRIAYSMAKLRVS